MTRDTVFINDDRFYQWREMYLVGVTTALKLGYPKIWFEKWAAGQMADAVLAQPMRAWSREELIAVAALKRGAAAEHGTDRHDQLELLGGGAEIDHPEINEWARIHQPEFLWSEAQVFNLDKGYAGTVDAIVRIGGKVYLMDLKTGNVRDAAIKLQLAAYKNAQFIGEGGKFIAPMPQVDACGILTIPQKKESSWGMYEVIVGNKEWEVFLGCLQTAQYQIEMKGFGILGRKI